MQKGSVLFLTNAYPDFESSYRGIFIRKMALLLQQHGYGISVVTPKIYKESRRTEEQQGIRVYRFPFFSGGKLLIEHDRIPYLRMVLYYLSGFFFTLYAILKHRCGMIHIHWAIPTGLIGVLAGALLRKPFIVTVHGSDFRLAMDRSSLLKRIFVSVCVRATHLHCVSEMMTKEIEKLGIRRKKISTFPMGIDQDFLEVGRERKVSLNYRPVTIVSNRNLLPIYNVSSLIRSIPIVLREEPHVKLLIAGDGAEREKLEKEAENLKVKEFVQFLGRIPHEKMPDLLSQADIYVSTSLYDGTSVSLLEALASGAFPVVTDIPANREWISDGENGFLFPIKKEECLARKILEAIRDPAFVEKSRRLNLSIVKEDALWPVTIDKVKKMYEQVLGLEM